MLETIRTKPHVFLLKFCLVFGFIGLSIALYDNRVGYSFSDQGEIEQLFRFIFGSMILQLPQLLFFALIYWLMYRFNKPTQPKLNALHIGLQMLGIIIGLVIGYENLFGNDYSYRDRYRPMNILSMIISFSYLVIFITNIVISFKKARSVDLP